MFMYEFEQPSGSNLKTNHLELRTESAYGGVAWSANGYSIDEETYKRLEKKMADDSSAFAAMLERMSHTTNDTAPSEEYPIITESCLGITGKGAKVLIVPNDGSDGSEYSWKCVDVAGGGVIAFTCNSAGESKHPNYVSRVTDLPEVNITEPCIGYTRKGVEVLIAAFADENRPWKYWIRTSGVRLPPRHITANGISDPNGRYTEHDVIFTRQTTMEDYRRHLNHPQA